jgi:hypothetical protein
MSYEIRAYASPTIDLNKIGKIVSIERWAEPIILPERANGPEVRTSLDSSQEYLYVRAFFSEFADINRILRKFGEGIGEYLEWGRVEWRKNKTEYLESKYKNNKDYYDPSLSEGLLTDVDVRKKDHLLLEVSDVDYILQGEKFSLSSTEIEMDTHPVAKRKDVIYIDQQGELKISKGNTAISPDKPNTGKPSVELATVELYPSEIIGIDENTQYEQYDVGEWTTAYEIGTVPTEV